MKFRPAARSDLVRLVNNLVARGAFTAAQRLADALNEQTAKLAVAPFLGSPGPEKTLRQWVFRFGRSQYVIRYRITDEAVIITRIWHGRESLAPR